MENYVDFAVQKAVELLAIDSPTGYTAEAEEFVLREFRALGFAAERTALISIGPFFPPGFRCFLRAV